LAYESGVANTVDPLAGSYYVEALTNEMEEKAMDYIKKVDDMGGAIPAIEKGFFQREIADSAYRYQREIDEKKRTIVGVNNFAIDGKEECLVELLRVDPKVEKEQVASLQRLKRERDNTQVKEVLNKLHYAAQRDENLMPLMIEAMKNYVTLGEVTEVLKQVYGEYKELIVV
jgi:methylmalonyl-CoA mutase N-terminal domain/subunit